MNIINTLITLLVILPIFGVLSDMKEGKIKNYFIFPSFIFIIILSFFIEGFFLSTDNLLSIAIIILFGYIFYINNKWGAGDGKYFMLLGLSCTIIGYLKGENGLILKMMFYIFLIFLIFSAIYIVKEFNKIKKIKLKNFKLEYINTLYSISILNISSSFLINYLPTQYAYIILFIILMVVIPIFEKINLRGIKLLIIIFCIFITIINSSYIGLAVISIVFIIFRYLGNLFEQIFDSIDIKGIKIRDLQQGNILTEGSINKIKNDADISLFVSPLQGNEIYDIIKYYKNIKKDGETITIYKDIKIGIIMYVGFVICVIGNVYLSI